MKRINEFVHPDHEKWLMAGGDEELQAILPKLSTEEHSYWTLLGSENYYNLVANLKKYIGFHPAVGGEPEVYKLVMKAVQDVSRIESSHKKELEKLAIDLVLSLDEFKTFKQAYDDGYLKITATLAAPSMEDFKSGDEDKSEEQAPEGELTPEEKENAELAKMFKGINLSDINTRRRLANLMIAGGSFSKMYVFHLAEEQLNAIDPKLVNLYGIVGVVAEYLYWTTIPGTEGQVQSGGGAVGVESVKAGPDGTYIVTAKALNFCYVCHELVKALLELNSIDPEMKDILRGEKVEDETKDVMMGPALFKKIMAMIPTDEQHLMPMVQRKLVYLPTVDAQEVLRQTQKGKQIFDKLVNDARQEWDAYKSAREQHNEEQV